jgi:hypothetical protein
MKIFFVADFSSPTYSLKIQRDDGCSIVFSGKFCGDHPPAPGVELYAGDEERLKKFLTLSKNEAVQMDGCNIFNQGMFKGSD